MSRMGSLFSLTYGSLRILCSFLLLLSCVLVLACLYYLRICFSDFLLRFNLCFLGLENLGNHRILDIDRNIVRLRHLAVEIHTAAHGAHLSVTAHELILGNQDWCTVLAEVVTFYIVFILLRKN